MIELDGQNNRGLLGRHRQIELSRQKVKPATVERQGNKLSDKGRKGTKELSAEETKEGKEEGKSGGDQGK